MKESLSFWQKVALGQASPYDRKEYEGARGSSSFDRWTCINCGNHFPLDTELTKCPKCLASLARWRDYEIKS